MRGGLDAGKSVDFVDGALLQLGVILEALDRHYLDSVLLLVLNVDCLINLAIHALSDGFVERIVIDDSGHAK